MSRSARGCGLILFAVIAGIIAAVAISTWAPQHGRVRQPAPSATVAPGQDYGIRAAVSFMGMHDHAERLAYVCDWSGTLLPAHRRLVEELSDSIARLTGPTAFAFIPCARPPAIPVPPTGMALPEAFAKQAAYRLINAPPLGPEPDMIAGLRRAFDAEPDTIYLVASGGIDESAVIYCRQHTADRRIRIHVLAVVRDSGITRPDDIDSARNLRRIARETGGEFRWITVDRLRRPDVQPDP